MLHMPPVTVSSRVRNCLNVCVHAAPQADSSVALDSASSVVGESVGVSEPSVDARAGDEEAPQADEALEAPAAPPPPPELKPEPKPEPKQAPEARQAPVPNAWDKPLLPNGVPAGGAALGAPPASAGARAAAAAPDQALASPAPGVATDAALSPSGRHAASVLFAGGPDAFGPSLVSALSAAGREPEAFTAPPGAAEELPAASHDGPAGAGLQAPVVGLGLPGTLDSNGGAVRGAPVGQQHTPGFEQAAATAEPGATDRRGDRASGQGRARGEPGARSERTRTRERGDRGRGRGARGGAPASAADNSVAGSDDAVEDAAAGRARGSRRGGEARGRGRGGKPVAVSDAGASAAGPPAAAAPPAPAASSAVVAPALPRVQQPTGEAQQEPRAAAPPPFDAPATVPQAPRAEQPAPAAAPPPSERGGVEQGAELARAQAAHDLNHSRVVHLSPALDPVAPLLPPAGGGYGDGAVLARPRSAGAGPPGGPPSLAIGGMPQLPADLSLGGPGAPLGGPGAPLGEAGPGARLGGSLGDRGASPLARLPGSPAGGAFGFLPPPPLAGAGAGGAGVGAGAGAGALLPGGAFPGVFFPLAGQAASLWQPQPPPLPQHALGGLAPASQAALQAGGGGGGRGAHGHGALPSFYQQAAHAAQHGGAGGGLGGAGVGGAGAGAFGGGLGGPQFGAFGSQAMHGLQFGQVVGGFGQSPFVPTGAPRTLPDPLLLRSMHHVDLCHLRSQPAHLARRAACWGLRPSPELERAGRGRARAGKQPDWSTGPISSGASHSPGPPQYARSPALESVLPHLPFGERRMSPELQGLARLPPPPPPSFPK